MSPRGIPAQLINGADIEFWNMWFDIQQWCSICESPSILSSLASYFGNTSISPKAVDREAWIGIPLISLNGVWMIPIGFMRNSVA